MKKIVISILGQDRTGIVYRVSKVLCDQGCNIMEASQTILQTEFAGIFIASMPEELTMEALKYRLEEELLSLGITVDTKEYKESTAAPVESEPFVITLRGPDRLGIIPAIAGIIAGFDVNIENLKAIGLRDDPARVVLVYEVAIPTKVHRPAFREALKWKADELGMEISIQHRDIFEAIHRL
ncbi:MAG: ACT domain-containing protein [Thermodesulfobacteriota bacterium]